ncbi:MAG: polyprenyl synthetase family protein [Deltaproteobacteria bacterium]|nr:polyprenyl synthetase family protein [Deltaproteobacteria bacterium]
MKLNIYLETKKSLIDNALETFFAERKSKKEGPFALLYEAMHYSLFPSGKRLRPILTCAAAEAIGGKTEDVLPIACAIEMIHTYSLIHDDLPAMDNDDYRRGKPTNHMKYGEATAILAGDALVTEAFGLLSQARKKLNTSPDLFLEVIEDIALGCGASGMIGGQLLDIQFQERSKDEDVNYPELEFLYIRKTGNLILVAITSGAKICGATPEQVKALSRYGENLGLAFQVVDDILDIHDDYKGPDGRKRAAFPSILSMDETKQRSRELASRAIEALQGFDHKADPLREIAHYIVERRQ